MPLTSLEIRAKATEINARFEEERQKSLAAEREGRRLQKELAELQSQCSHPSTNEEPVQDCAELKHRKFCADCGAEVRPKF